MIDWIKENIKGDKYIWAIIIALFLTSLLVVYSATGTLAYFNESNPEIYLIKHLALSVLSLAIIFAAHVLDYKNYSRISLFLLIVSVPLLLYTLLNGTELNDARRWIRVPGLGFSFQTSDLAKLALVMFVSRQLALNQFDIRNYRKVLLPVVVAIVVICGLIVPNNLSTALILMATCLILAFVGRIPIAQLGTVGLLSVLLFGAYVLVEINSPGESRVETWKNRIVSFWDEDRGDDFQSNQAKIAVATGGIVGKGPGNSTQRHYLPQAYSDFIYAIIIEEYGTIGGAAMLLLFLGLLYRCVLISYRAPNSFGALLVLGLSFSLVIQAFINALTYTLSLSD